MRLFLGVDGGQSSAKALIGDEPGPRPARRGANIAVRAVRPAHTA